MMYESGPFVRSYVGLMDTLHIYGEAVLKAGQALGIVALVGVVLLLILDLYLRRKS